ncbi:MAG TPA: hypothetical protein VJS44_05020 [Pyrinomonadaceae bacterium]|nr:hypothetical protein [Pyrinomonadaceae bacterium]
MKRNHAPYACLLSLAVLITLTASTAAFGQKREPAPDNYADLGNPEDEQFHDLRGWGNVNATLPKGMAADRTSRYQTIGRPNSVKLFVPQIAVPYDLTIRSEAGVCDDSFEVYVNGNGPLYVYKNKEAARMKALHHITLDASLITDTAVEVTFKNIAEDACGRAAINYVSLEPSDEKGRQGQSSLALAPLKLERAMQMTQLFIDREQIDVSGYTLTEARLDDGDEGERRWRLRWEKSGGKREDYLEFTVSMDGMVSYRLTR